MKAKRKVLQIRAEQLFRFEQGSSQALTITQPTVTLTGTHMTSLTSLIFH